jgi:tetratricopeptide (TPR) repeat protein
MTLSKIMLRNFLNSLFMKSLLFLCIAAVIFPYAVHSQTKESQPKESLGRGIIRSAFAYQNKLQDSTATLDEVIRNWSNAASNSEVRKDKDALAIAYGSEGVLEIQKGEKHKADSLLRKAMPLFQYRWSKAPILVAYAELERSLKSDAAAMGAYDEIVHTMDSVAALWDIQFYRLSGYAPFAYAIDACYGMVQIADQDAKEKKKAISVIQYAFDKHPNDALGMMAIVALHRLGALDDEAYKFQVDLLCSRKPELRKTNDLFEKKFTEASNDVNKK